MGAKILETNYFVEKYKPKYEKFNYSNFLYWVRQGLIPAEKDGETFLFKQENEKMIDTAVHYMMTVKRPTIKKAIRHLQEEGFTVLVNEITKKKEETEQKQKIASELDEKLDEAIQATTSLANLPEDLKEAVEEVTGTHFSDILEKLQVLYELKESIYEMTDKVDDIHTKVNTISSQDDTLKDIKTDLNALETQIKQQPNQFKNEIDSISREITTHFSRIMQEQSLQIRKLDQFVGGVAKLNKVLNPFAASHIKQAQKLVSETSSLQIEHNQVKEIIENTEEELG